MKTKVIIFGMDNVLCHLEKYHYLAWKQIAQELEIPFTREQNKRLTGLSRMESLERILVNYTGNLSKAEKEVLAEQKNNCFRKYLEQITEVDCNSHVKAVLEELKNRGYILTVASFSKNAGQILQKTKLEPYIEFVSDGNTVKRSKPSAELFLNICKCMYVGAEECLIVEGTDKGIIAGKKAGIPTIAVGECDIWEEDIERIADISELPDYLAVRELEIKYEKTDCKIPR